MNNHLTRFNLSRQGRRHGLIATRQNLYLDHLGRFTTTPKKDFIATGRNNLLTHIFNDIRVQIPVRLNRRRIRRSGKFMLRQFNHEILNSSNSPVAEDQQLSRSSTRAPGGPELHQVRICCKAPSRPSAIISTRPSERFQTVPTSPRLCALERVEARYQTPCTRPLTTICKRFPIIKSLLVTIPVTSSNCLDVGTDL